MPCPARHQAGRHWSDPAAGAGTISNASDLTELSRSELDAALSGEHEHRAASAVELVADLSGDDHMTFRRTGL